MDKKNIKKPIEIKSTALLTSYNLLLNPVSEARYNEIIALAEYQTNKKTNCVSAFLPGHYLLTQKMGIDSLVNSLEFIKTKNIFENEMEKQIFMLHMVFPFNNKFIETILKNGISSEQINNMRMKITILERKNDNHNLEIIKTIINSIPKLISDTKLYYGLQAGDSSEIIISTLIINKVLEIYQFEPELLKKKEKTN